MRADLFFFFFQASIGFQLPFLDFWVKHIKPDAWIWPHALSFGDLVAGKVHDIANPVCGRFHRVQLHFDIYGQKCFRKKIYTKIFGLKISQEHRRHIPNHVCLTTSFQFPDPTKIELFGFFFSALTVPASNTRSCLWGYHRSLLLSSPANPFSKNPHILHDRRDTLPNNVQIKVL